MLAHELVTEPCRSGDSSMSRPALRTTMALRHEVVAGGYLIRITLSMKADDAPTYAADTQCGCGCDKFVRGLRVTLSPGLDATLIEARHPFESRSEEGLLRIDIGALRVGESGDVAVDAVIARTAAARRVAGVAHVAVSARVWDGAGDYDLHAIELPITFCTRSGAAAAPRVSTRPGREVI